MAGCIPALQHLPASRTGMQRRLHLPAAATTRRCGRHYRGDGSRRGWRSVLCLPHPPPTDKSSDADAPPRAEDAEASPLCPGRAAATRSKTRGLLRPRPLRQPRREVLRRAALSRGRWMSGATRRLEERRDAHPPTPRHVRQNSAAERGDRPQPVPRRHAGGAPVVYPRGPDASGGSVLNAHAATYECGTRPRRCRHPARAIASVSRTWDRRGRRRSILARNLVYLCFGPGTALRDRLLCHWFDDASYQPMVERRTTALPVHGWGQARLLRPPGRLASICASRVARWS